MWWFPTASIVWHFPPVWPTRTETLRFSTFLLWQPTFYENPTFSQYCILCHTIRILFALYTQQFCDNVIMRSHCMRGLLQGVRSAYSTRAVWHKSQYMGFIIANFLLSLVMFWFVDRKLSRTTTFTMKMADRIEHSRNAQLARVSFCY